MKKLAPIAALVLAASPVAAQQQPLDAGGQTNTSPTPCLAPDPCLCVTGHFDTTLGGEEEWTVREAWPRFAVLSGGRLNCSGADMTYDDLAARVPQHRNIFLR